MCTFQNYNRYIHTYTYTLMHVASNHDKLIPQHWWATGKVRWKQTESVRMRFRFWQVVSGLSLWNQGPHQALWSQLLTEITNHHLPIWASDMHVAWKRRYHKATDADRHIASASGIFPQHRLADLQPWWLTWLPRPHPRSPSAIPITSGLAFLSRNSPASAAN